MGDEKWIQALEAIAMPEKTKSELTDRCMRKQRSGNIVLRHARLITAALCAAGFMAVCCPTYAAYHLYQVKHINVFFDSDITKEQISEIGETIGQMDEVYDVRFVTAQEAWDVFQNKYFTGEFSYLSDMLEENPLQNSYHYYVTVKLNADEEKVREVISGLEGVRRVSDLCQEGY